MSDKYNKSSSTKKLNNNFIKMIIQKVKNELVNDEVKNELIYPIYDEIHAKILPHYITFFVMLSTIILLLIILIMLNITRFKQ